MRLQFLHNAGFILLVNLTVKPFWIFAIDRQVQNQAGPAAYGEYYALVSFSLLLGALLDAGLANYNAREVAIKPEKGLAQLPQLLGLKSVLFAVYLLLTLSSAALLNYPKAALLWLLLICVNLGINFLNTYLRSNLAGLHLFKLEGALGALDKLLMSLGAIPLVMGHYFLSGTLLLDFILVQTIAYGLTSLVLLGILAKHLALGIRFSIPQQTSILRSTLPFALLGILMGLYTKLDAVMLENLLDKGAYAAGIYAAGYRLLDAATMVPVLLSGMLLPQFARMLAEKEVHHNFIRTVSLLLGGLSFVVALSCWSYSGPIMQLLYTHVDPIQEQVFALLMLSFIPLSLNYVFGTLLTAGGRMKRMNLLATAGLALNLALNLWLIPSMGAKGAAIATLATQSLVFSMQFLSCYRWQNWHIDRSLTLRLLGFVGTALLANYFIRQATTGWGLAANVLTGGLLLLLFFGKPVYQLLLGRLKDQINSRN